GGTGWAARLVERHVEALLRRGEGATLARWLSALPAESIRARSRLCLAQAVAAIVGGRLEEAEPLLASAEHAFAATGDEPHEPSVGRARSVLANVPAAIAFLRADLARWRGDPARAADCARLALTHLGEEERLLRSHVAGTPAGVDWLRGRLAQAEQGLAELAAKRRAADEGFPAMRARYELGQVQHAQGCLGAALHTHQQALQTAGGAGQQPPFAGMPHVGLAEVVYE